MGTIPFIQNKDFASKKINYDTDYYIPEIVANKFPRILLDEKCLLISISGSIGKIGLFSNSQKSFIGGAVAVAKFIDKDLLEWVMFYLLSNEGQKKLHKNVKTGSHKNLILSDLREMTIPIPSTNERKYIIQILSNIDSGIEELEKKKEKHKMIKDGVTQKLFTGKIIIK
jgi:restriction endonuclease S subunit